MVSGAGFMLTVDECPAASCWRSVGRLPSFEGLHEVERLPIDVDAGARIS